MALRVWWQYQVLVWLRWRRQRQDGGCHQLWVTGSWGGEGGGSDSWVHGMQSIPLSVYVFVSPSPSLTVSLSICLFSHACQSVSTSLSSLSRPSISVPLSLSLSKTYICIFFLPCLSLSLYPDDGWMNFALSSPCQTLHQEKQWETHK